MTSRDTAQRSGDQVKSYEESVFDEAPLGTVIRDEASHSEAMEALAEAESERGRNEVLLGCAFDADAKDGDAIAKLARYETRHERSLFRNLKELRQIQEKRRSSSISRDRYVGRERYPMTPADNWGGRPGFFRVRFIAA
jgi:hypothetical protein